MELYGFMEREKKIPSYFFIITKQCQTELKEKVADNLSQKEDGREYEGIDDSLKATIIEKLCYTKLYMTE